MLAIKIWMRTSRTYTSKPGDVVAALWASHVWPARHVQSEEHGTDCDEADADEVQPTEVTALVLTRLTGLQQSEN